MDSIELRSRREQPSYHDLPRLNPDHHPSASNAAPALSPDRIDGDAPGYTLMAAGRRTGKTAFLRLLLDTSLVSPSASQDQLASVAKFVQGCAGYTSHIRTVSLNVDLPVGHPISEKSAFQTLTLSLIDTPSLDFDDPAASQRTVDEIMRHVDTRFSESVEDDRKAYAGDHHVHLCIYFLDPDTIVPPPSVSVAPAPMASRARNNSLSKPDPEPVILEPPVTTNPLLCRPTLPQADIATIRRLSVRVNVLPVVGRADLLTNDRLTAVKIAVRRDLADAGIGFGIFDNTPQHAVYGSDVGIIVPKVDQSNGYAMHVNGVTASTQQPTAVPPTPLPYALISPDIYSHSDGVSRPMPPRHDLVLQYTPSYHNAPKQRPVSNIMPGKWVRSYRWGNLDCMDASHCDFLQLRGAIFHHMKTLQKYTREFLLQRFRTDYLSQNPPPPLPRTQRSPLNSRLPPMSHGSRPILAIDTAPDHLSGNRRPSMSVARGAVNGENGNPSLPAPAALMPELSPKTASSTRSQRTRTKKITVACNFCRSRKLKCDGGRPACSQCFKRSNACDYMASHKRRGNGKRRKVEDGSESDGDGEGDSAEPSADLEPSQSPEVSSLTHSRRNSSANGTENAPDGVKLPPLNGTIAAALDRHDESTKLPPIMLQGPPLAPERAFIKHELPPIATLPPVPPDRDIGQSLPPLRTAAEMEQSASVSGPQRRRTSSAASSKGRQNGYSSKIVACNFCRARKTRCDGVHPSCGSCARRSLPCNYVNDREANNPKGRPKTATAGPSAAPAAQAPPITAQSMPLTGTYNGYGRQDANGSGDQDLKRNLDVESAQPNKKMRVTDGFSSSPVAVPQLT